MPCSTICLRRRPSTCASSARPRAIIHLLRSLVHLLRSLVHLLRSLVRLLRSLVHRSSTPRKPAVIELPKITMEEAIALAHGWEMQHDDSVVVIGPDVGANGGVFRATAGLQSRFGTDRVQDTPLAEAMIAGMSVGMATHGLKPVAEIQFMGFLYPALDQIVNHMSRMRNRTRGRLSCPVVIRTPHGGGIHAPEHHSESTETMLCHIPGIRVVCPSSPARAYGLLLAAIRDPDPVMFLQPCPLYRP